MATREERIRKLLEHRAIASASLARAETQTGLPAEDGAAPRLVRSQLSGRITELSGRGAVAPLTAAVGLVVEAQVEGEPVAWITCPDSAFYPPDLARSGVDLDALVVVRVPPRTGGAAAVARAAERLLRSGAFGLVILDLVEGADSPASSASSAAAKRIPPAGRGGRRSRDRDAIPIALQGRLASLANVHDAAVVCLTGVAECAPSLGSMVSLRAEVLRQRGDGGHFRCKVVALKDKRRGPGWSHEEGVRGPAGLR